jgi:DNA-binding CsgD family transcriptional regulator
MQVFMQTVQQGLEERQLMIELAADLAQDWRSRLACECPEQSAATRESIIRWLVGNDIERLEQLRANGLEIIQQAMAYRYSILRQRYLGATPDRAYRHLMSRLSSSVLLRNKIRTLVALSRDRQRMVGDVLQEVLQELLQSDRYMQQQMAWIAKCTNDAKLRNALLLASMEEYCLRPVRNQPLLVYRFVNYLRRTSRGGVTQVPTQDRVRLVSEEILSDESDSPLSLLDTQASIDYQEKQAQEEQLAQRRSVEQEFASYLATTIGSQAVQWLKLYLQGKSQEAIARRLNLSVQEVYRLREKISYHAVRVFGLKHQPELVSDWLGTSLLEHSFGLTPQQWQQYWARLTPKQQQVIELKKAGKNNEEIAQDLNLKTYQVMTQWSKLYLTAQAVRGQG